MANEVTLGFPTENPIGEDIVIEIVGLPLEYAVIYQDLPFDSSSCYLSMSAGFTGSFGGDTFDCYGQGEQTSLQLGGVGFAAAWAVGNSTIAYPYGDDFDIYLQETSSTNTYFSGSGFSGSWCLA